MQAIQNLPPIVGLILGFVLLAWLVFAFLVPFMVEGIRQSNRRIHAELVELNKKMDALTAALTEARAAPRAPADGAADARAPEPPRGGQERRTVRPSRSTPAKGAKGRTGTERGRREPTISETDFGSGPGPDRPSRP